MDDDVEISAEQPAEAPQTLDDVLNSTFDEIESREESETPKQASDRVRDDSGRFSAKTPAVVPAIAGDIVVPAVQAPNTWTPAVKEKFSTLPPDVQQEIMKRETDMARAITLHDQDRSFGKTVKDVVTPYLPMIQAENATPESAIQSLLNTAYRLRTSSPQEKGQLLANLARQYGADMSAFGGDQEQAQIDPTVAALQQKLQQLEGFITQQHTQQQTVTEQNLLRDINAFQADPAHPHFEQVGQHMASLIKAGMAADLQDAYNQAIYLHPDVRQQVISAQQSEAQRKQIEEAKLKAEQAKKTASVNLYAKPSLPAKAQPGTIDQTLAERYDSLMSAA